MRNIKLRNGASLALKSIGIGLDCRNQIGMLTNAARLAEKNGFRGAWAVQYFYYKDPFIVLSMAASATTTIKLGTAVTNVYERHPLTVAMSAASTDEIAGGRLILGLGTGSPLHLSHEMGMPYSNPRARLKEAVFLIRSFLQQKAVQYDGKFFHVQGATLGFKPPRQGLPIYLAAIGPMALTLAANVADGVVLNYGTTPEYCEQAVNQLRRVRGSLSKFEVTSLVWVVLETSKDNIVAAKRRLAVFYSNPGFGEAILPFTCAKKDLLKSIRKFYYAAEGRRDDAAAGALISDEILNSVMLIGKRKIESRIEDYLKAGISHPILIPFGTTKLEKLVNVASINS